MSKKIDEEMKVLEACIIGLEALADAEKVGRIMRYLLNRYSLEVDETGS